MTYNSKNMNYVFNREYFEGLDISKIDSFDAKSRNKDLFEFLFPGSDTYFSAWRHLPGYLGIELYSQYPGLLLGIGNPHDIKANGAIKCGFSFDYTSGLPYLPGSSLKGVLRSYFPSEGENENESEKAGYIRSLLPVEKQMTDIVVLGNLVFNNSVVFLGGFPVTRAKEELLASEWITPHKELKNPNPISLIKVKPGVKFEFGFLVPDSTVKQQSEIGDGKEICISKEEIKILFTNILIDMGVGAKTNVGFGKLDKEAPLKMNKQKQEGKTATTKNPSNKKTEPGKCQKCGKAVGINPITGEWYRYCYDCNQKKRNSN